MAEEDVLETAGKAVNSFWKELVKFATDLFAAFLAFILLIFVLGVMYGVYFMQTGNTLLLWMPAFLLMVVLAYYVIE